MGKAQQGGRRPSFPYGGEPWNDQHTFHGKALCLLQWFKRYKVTIMLRTFPRLTLSISLLACVGAVCAQTAQTGQTSPAAPAATTGQPPTERIEPESETPATNIEPRRGTQIREKRNNGQVTEVEVQSGRSRYVLKPNQPAGNAVPGDAQSSAFRAPQWQVMEFDLNAKKKAAADAAAAAAAAGTAAPGAAAPGTATASAQAQKPAVGNVPAATVPMTKPADIPPPPPMPTTR